MCVCVIGPTVYFHSFCVHGLDCMQRTEGRRVSHCQQATDREKHGQYLQSVFYTTAVGVKPNLVLFLVCVWGGGIASESLQLKCSSMLESRHLCRQRAMSRQCIFIALSTSSLWFVDVAELLRGSSAARMMSSTENNVSKPEDIAVLSLDREGIWLEQGPQQQKCVL